MRISEFIHSSELIHPFYPFSCALWCYEKYVSSLSGEHLMICARVGKITFFQEQATVIVR